MEVWAQPRVEILPGKSAKNDKAYRFARNLSFADLYLDTKLNRKNWIERLHIIYQTPFESDERLITNGFEAASKKLIEAGYEATSKAHGLLEDGKPEFAEVFEILSSKMKVKKSEDKMGSKRKVDKNEKDDNETENTKEQENRKEEEHTKKEEFTEEKAIDEEARH
ncbi:hypothetical protein LIER_42127 [Lithospermum erythrorhizon]|uniref:Uncharacterized protein n=1 Tax=Lithospermum erythrorhizon TaxID=34254 RepID=A0AAV3RLP2_LITER